MALHNWWVRQAGSLDARVAGNAAGCYPWRTGSGLSFVQSQNPSLLPLSARFFGANSCKTDFERPSPSGSREWFANAPAYANERADRQA